MLEFTQIDIKYQNKKDVWCNMAVMVEYNSKLFEYLYDTCKQYKFRYSVTPADTVAIFIPKYEIEYEGGTITSPEVVKNILDAINDEERWY